LGSDSSETIPIGAPRTLVLLSSGISAGTWANTCPYCGAVQGNWFLYHEPDGAFFGWEDLKHQRA
jgi:hypothetical protein